MRATMSLWSRTPKKTSPANFQRAFEMKYSGLLMTSAFIFGVAGCGTLPAVKENANKVETTVAQAKPALKMATAHGDAVGYGCVKITPADIIGGTSHKVSTGERLPRKSDREGVTQVSPRTVRLQQMGDVIMGRNGITVGTEESK